MDAARDHGGGKMMRARDHVADNLCVRGIRHARLKDANHGGGTIANAAEANCFADYVRIFLVNGGPETIGEHDDAGRVGTVVLGSDEAAENRTQAHYFKVVAADDATSNSARFTESDHGKAHRREIAELAHGVDAGFDVPDFGHGESCVVVSQAEGALADVHEPVLVTVDERLQQHSTHEREDGCVGPDAKRQGEDHNGREPFAAH